MNERSAFKNKLIYLAGIVVLLVPLIYLSQPGYVDAQGAFHGGKLAELRKQEGLSQASLGEIDPISESFKLATLGLRPLAVVMLWEKSHYYKKVEDWSNFEATLNQIIRLQPNFISVWEFQAHNLAYNISAEMDDWRDKYYYVVKGMKFLISGTQYNTFNSQLLGRVGWFVSDKIGRSDERVLFRKKFAKDAELQEYFGQYIDTSKANNDSWLVGKEWYLQGQDAADHHSSPVRGESSVIFYSHAPMCQINYCDSLEKEGHFDEREKILENWRLAEQEWLKFGKRPFVSAEGTLFTLEEQEAWQEKAIDASEKLEALVGPEAREKLRAEKQAKLVQEKAIDARDLEIMAMPAEKRTKEQQGMVNVIESRLAIEERELAAAAPREKLAEAKRLLTEYHMATDRAQLVGIYREHVNYAFWRAKCQAQQSEDAFEGSRLIYTALEQQKKSSLTDETKKMFEDGFTHWHKVGQQFPLTLDDSTRGYDLHDAVKKYYKLLADRGEKYPPDGFVFKELYEEYEKKN